MRSPGTWPADFVAVSIDDATLDRRGRWPWPRGKIAELLLATKAAGATTIALDAVVTGETDPVADLELERALGGVILAVSGSQRGSGVPADARLRGALFSTTPPGIPPIAPANVMVPHARFTNAAAGLGHTLTFAGRDQIVRSHSPLLPVKGEAGSLPSLALAALAHQRGWARDALAMDGNMLVLPGGRRLRLYNGDGYLDWVPGH